MMIIPFDPVLNGCVNMDVASRYSNPMSLIALYRITAALNIAPYQLLMFD